jgi:hypothetical protein
MTEQIIKMLSGEDLRSVGNSNAVVKETNTQQGFDDLFDLVFHKERVIAMRAADAIEKITVNRPQFLKGHKNALLSLLLNAEDIEIKWHVAMLVARLKLTRTELKKAWERLKFWALDKNESRIVRVNSIQALFDLLKQADSVAPADLLQIVDQVSKENIPSVKARLKRLTNAINALKD